MPNPQMGVLAGAQVLGTAQQGRASRDATRAQQQAAAQGIAAQDRALRSFERRTQPFADVGLSAANPLLQLLGIGGVQGVGGQQSQFVPIFENQAELAAQADQMIGNVPDLAAFDRAGARQDIIEGLAQQRGLTPINQPTQAAQAPGVGGDGLLGQINPLVDFLRQEGFEDIQETAAARGRLGAGGTLEDLTRFNTQLTSTIVPQLQQQRFNQLFNVLGLGANVATGQGTAAMQTGSDLSNLYARSGLAGAQGAQTQGDILTGGLGGLIGIGQRQGLLSPPPPSVPPAVGGIQNPNLFGGFA